MVNHDVICHTSIRMYIYKLYETLEAYRHLAKNPVQNEMSFDTPPCSWGGTEAELRRNFGETYHTINHRKLSSSALELQV